MLDKMSENNDQIAQVARMLIVDDVADNREVLARRFERRGYATVQAEGGAQALRLIEAGEFDIVLLDVMMPEVDGFEVLARVRETQSAIELPVVLVTALAESRDVVRGLELGANDYITKPVDFAIALARVETQVGRSRAEMALVRSNRALEQKVSSCTRPFAAPKPRTARRPTSSPT